MKIERDCNWKPEETVKERLYTEQELKMAWYYGSTISFEEALTLIKEIK